MQDLENPALMASTSQTSEVQSGYRPPTEFHMGPPVYPPARTVNDGLRIPEIKERIGKFKGRKADYTNQWTLPPAQIQTGVILVLPPDISKYEDVITRWESINLNVINRMTWVDNNAKVNFIENLLGEMEKRMFQQWRNTYASEYEALVNIADDPHNVLSQIRRIITLEDPYQGTTAAQ